jgi:feruloyl esterase
MVRRRGRSRWFAVPVLGFLGALALAGQGAAQSNGSSFTDPGEAARLARLPRRAPAMRCHDLSAAGSANLTILSADVAGNRRDLCRVHAVIPAEIEFMLELPRAWNGRLYVLGNGGYGGESVTGDYALAERTRATELGFASLFTNLGHDRAREPGADWARGSLARKLDYGLRGLHVTTAAAKELLQRYYGKPARHSYFDGCSTGGGQALKAAQRFPQDYDGILGGAPVFDFAELQLYGWNNQMAILDAPLSAQTVARLAHRLLELYDAADGVRDGVIDDPLRIDFDPERDLSRQEFTAAEIRALARIYRGTFIDGRRVAPGVPVGAEAAGQMYAGAGFDPAPPESGWATRLAPDSHGAMQQRGNVEAWLRYLAFENDEPDMDITRFVPARDVARLAFMSRILDAKDPDLEAFRARGGKLILYHGWADTGVNPLTTVRYFERVRDRMGTGVDSFARLYMVPGMFHCRGGLNVDRFDALAALIAWVERAEAPRAIVASRMQEGRVVRTRPLCPFPQTAHYQGAGSTDDARSFRCETPQR